MRDSSFLLSGSSLNGKCSEIAPLSLKLFCLCLVLFKDSKRTTETTPENVPVMEPSDEILAQRALSGDSDAFMILVERYQNTIFHVALRMLGDSHDAEDLTQEVFLRCYQSLGRYDPARPFFSWIYRIAVNCCLTARKRPTASALDEQLVAALATEEPSPEQHVMRDETQALVQTLLGLLPEQDRSIIALRYDAELSYDQIAQILRLPLGTVKTRLFRARQRLADLLKDQAL